MLIRRPYRRAQQAIAVAATLSVLTLTACANPLEQLVQKGAEGAVEKLIEQNTGASVDIDQDGEGGSITLGDDDVKLNMGSNASLPQGWPDIPVPDGTIRMSTETADGMQVIFDTIEGEIERLLDAYRSAGFESVHSLELGEIKSEQFEKGSMRVMIQTLPGEDDMRGVQMMVFTGSE